MSGEGISPVEADAGRGRLQPRLGGDEGGGIGVERREMHGVGGADLHDAAEVDHHDPVGDVAHDREVVRDEEERDAGLRPQVVQEIQDLCLDRDVERRDRLVGRR